MNIFGSSTFIGNNVLLASTATTSAYIDNLNNNPITITALGNASIQDKSNSYTIIGTGTSVIGNLTVTNANSGTLIEDQGGLSSLTVGANAIFTAANGSVQFTGASNTFGGLATVSSGTSIVNALGNLVLIPGNSASIAYYTATYANASSPGNITTSGSGSIGTFAQLNLTSTKGTSVTISNPIRVTTALNINAPFAAVNLGAISKSVELLGSTITVTGNASYIAPIP